MIEYLTSTFLTLWRWQGTYKYTLGVACFVAWLAVVYLFGLSAWLPQLVLFALLSPLILVALKYRLLGILVIIISLSFGLLTLFWWQSSASFEATAQVVNKRTETSGTAPVTHYYLLLTFDRTGKSIEVTEDTYESINKYEVLTIRYRKEVFGTGHWEHTVVESIGKGIVLDGGGMKLGLPGSSVIHGWLILIATGIGVLGLIPSIMTRPQKN